MTNKNKQQRSQRKNRQQKRQASGRILIENSKLSQSRQQVHSFSRVTAPASVGIVPATGLGGTAQFNMQFSFSLQNTLIYINGTLVSTNANPGYSDFTSLFDEYALESVEMSFMCDLNSVNPGAVGTMTLPILNIVFDPNDSALCSLSDVLQYQDLHTVQLGNQRTANGYVLKFKPTPLITASLPDGSFAGSRTQNGLNWLACRYPTVPHLGIKLFYDNCGSTLATEGGSLVFYIKYNWKMRTSL
jgi:hypothetical protein